MDKCSNCGKMVEIYAHHRKCADCYNTYMKNYMLKRYEQRMQEAKIKLGNKCVDCGSEEDLQFDHLDRHKKSKNISKMWSYSKKKFENELEKCVLRCQPCHKKISNLQMSVDHGGGLSGKKNCPCDLCKAKKSKYNKEHK